MEVLSLRTTTWNCFPPRMPFWWRGGGGVSGVGKDGRVGEGKERKRKEKKRKGKEKKRSNSKKRGERLRNKNQKKNTLHRLNIDFHFSFFLFDEPKGQKQNKKENERKNYLRSFAPQKRRRPRIRTEKK